MGLRSIGNLCGAIVLVLALQACASNKPLTASSAKAMLTESLKKKGDAYMVTITSVARQIRSQTREDYSAASFGDSDPRAQVGRLLKAGYITQAREDLTYRNVTGTYKCNTHSRWGNAIYTFTLSMQPGYNAVSGEYTFDWQYSESAGPVHGEVMQDGHLRLVYGPMSSQTTYEITVEGNTTRLTGPNLFVQDGGQMTVVGTGPGGFVTVPRYSYVFSDKFKELLDPSGDLIRGGKIEIDDVHNLLLATETVAAARVTWHADLNNAATILLGKDKIDGEGSATFGKQPDGAWVLTGFQM